MKLLKYQRRLTPSGLSDNGIWYLSEETVEFPKHLIKDAIVETIKLKEGSGYSTLPRTRYHSAFKVTIAGNYWYINKDPR